MLPMRHFEPDESLPHPYASAVVAAEVASGMTTNHDDGAQCGEEALPTGLRSDETGKAADTAYCVSESSNSEQDSIHSRSVSCHTPPHGSSSNSSRGGGGGSSSRADAAALFSASSQEVTSASIQSSEETTQQSATKDDCVTNGTKKNDLDERVPRSKSDMERGGATRAFTGADAKMHMYAIDASAAASSQRLRAPEKAEDEEEARGRRCHILANSSSLDSSDAQAASPCGRADDSPRDAKDEPSALEDDRDTENERDVEEEEEAMSSYRSLSCHSFCSSSSSRSSHLGDSRSMEQHSEDEQSDDDGGRNRCSHATECHNENDVDDDDDKHRAWWQGVTSQNRPGGAARYRTSHPVLLHTPLARYTATRLFPRPGVRDAGLPLSEANTHSPEAQEAPPRAREPEGEPTRDAARETTTPLPLSLSPNTAYYTSLPSHMPLYSRSPSQQQQQQQQQQQNQHHHHANIPQQPNEPHVPLSSQAPPASCYAAASAATTPTRVTPLASHHRNHHGSSNSRCSSHTPRPAAPVPLYRPRHPSPLPPHPQPPSLTTPSSWAIYTGCCSSSTSLRTLPHSSAASTTTTTTTAAAGASNAAASVPASYANTTPAAIPPRRSSSTSSSTAPSPLASVEGRPASWMTHQVYAGGTSAGAASGHCLASNQATSTTAFPNSHGEDRSGMTYSHDSNNNYNNNNSAIAHAHPYAPGVDPVALPYGLESHSSCSTPHVRAASVDSGTRSIPRDNYTYIHNHNNSSNSSSNNNAVVPLTQSLRNSPLPPRAPSEEQRASVLSHMGAVWVEMPQNPPAQMQPQHPESSRRRTTPRSDSEPPSPARSTLAASYNSVSLYSNSMMSNNNNNNNNNSSSNIFSNNNNNNNLHNSYGGCSAAHGYNPTKGNTNNHSSTSLTHATPSSGADWWAPDAMPYAHSVGAVYPSHPADPALRRAQSLTNMAPPTPQKPIPEYAQPMSLSGVRNAGTAATQPRAASSIPASTPRAPMERPLREAVHEDAVENDAESDISNTAAAAAATDATTVVVAIAAVTHPSAGSAAVGLQSPVKGGEYAHASSRAAVDAATATSGHIYCTASPQHARAAVTPRIESHIDPGRMTRTGQRIELVDSTRENGPTDACHTSRVSQPGEVGGVHTRTSAPAEAVRDERANTTRTHTTQTSSPPPPAGQMAHVCAPAPQLSIPSSLLNHATLPRAGDTSSSTNRSAHPIGTNNTNHNVHNDDAYTNADGRAGYDITVNESKQTASSLLPRGAWGQRDSELERAVQYCQRTAEDVHRMRVDVHHLRGVCERAALSPVTRSNRVGSSPHSPCNVATHAKSSSRAAAARPGSSSRPPRAAECRAYDDDMTHSRSARGWAAGDVDTGEVLSSPSTPSSASVHMDSDAEEGDDVPGGSEDALENGSTEGVEGGAAADNGQVWSAQRTERLIAALRRAHERVATSLHTPVELTMPYDAQQQNGSP